MRQKKERLQRHGVRECAVMGGGGHSLPHVDVLVLLGAGAAHASGDNIVSADVVIVWDGYCVHAPVRRVLVSSDASISCVVAVWEHHNGNAVGRFC